jgi:DNA-binding Lrp family transcriptional regulator
VYPLDILDKGILSDLVSNCRITFEELARKYGVSPNAIRKRIQKLESTGVIDGYSVGLVSAMIDASSVFGLAMTDGSKDEEEFVDKIGNHSHIIAAASYTDGIYAFIGEFTTPAGLMEIGTHVRGLDGVNNLELHTLIGKDGQKVELSNMHLKVLHSLKNDAKLSIVEIAKTTGLTARRVRKSLSELIEEQGVSFSAFVELGAASDIPFLVKANYDESVITPDQLKEWIETEFSLPIWQIYLSASEPIIICLFAVEHLADLDSICRKIRRQDFIGSTIAMVSTHHKYFAGLRSAKLTEMFKTTGLE